MKSNSLKLSVVIALSLMTLAACQKHGKKSEDAAAPDTTNAAVAAAPTTTAPATTPTTAAPVAAASGADAGGKKAWKLACADDIKKFCADADKPGKCLKQHDDQLSQACSAARAARKGHKADKGE